MKIIHIILAILFCLDAGAQNTFSVFGKIVDSTTQQPMPGASAFCPNTTYGTVSNNDGLFFLRLPPGGYDLVISYTGYIKKIIRLSSGNLPGDTLKVELSKEDKALAEVAVVGSNEVPNGWQKYGQFFLDNFLGTTPNAAQCMIKNPEALRFFFSKKRNRLRVSARENVIVMNYALGYEINYQLDSFTYEYNTNISQFTGYPLFKEIDTLPAVMDQWKKNRSRTYLGSRLHFMRALYDSVAGQEGFVVEKIGDDPASITGTPITDLYDTALYVKDTSDLEILWKGKYRVSYKRVPPDRTYLEEFKLPASARVQVSVADVSDSFIIEKNGYFYDQGDIINSGYWSWKKLAEVLPYDYKFE